MAFRGALLILACIACGVLSESDVNVVDINDVISRLTEQQDLDALVAQSNAIDALIDEGIVLEDNLDDVIQLTLEDSELVGGCSHGACRYCASKHFKFCLEAKLLKLGFELKVTVGSHTIFDKVISVANPPPVCVKAPLVGKVCIVIDHVNLQDRSACVSVEFKIGIIHKKIKVKIACFKIGKGEVDTRLSFVQLMQFLAGAKEINYE